MTAPVAAVDLGGTNINVALVTGDDRIIDRAHGETPLGDVGAAADLVAALLKELAARHAPPMALGVAAAGAIAHRAGLVRSAPNLRWTDAPLRAELEARVRLPVTLVNDVDAAVWGEFVAARAIDADAPATLLAVWVGTGVGGGLVLDGELVTGDDRSIIELGRTISEPDGPPEGRRLEEIAGRAGLQRQAVLDLESGRLDPGSRLGRATADALATGRPGPGTEDFGAAWHAGDRDARERLARAADRLGTAVANVVTLLGVPAVVVGGGMAEALGDEWLDLIAAAFRRDVFPEDLRATTIDLTRRRELAGLLGAADLARRAAATRGD